MPLDSQAAMLAVVFHAGIEMARDAGYQERSIIDALLAQLLAFSTAMERKGVIDTEYVWKRAQALSEELQEASR